MIKLKELLSVNEMTYNDGPTEKHQSKIDYPITLFEDFEISLMPYPENSSKQTIDELKELSLIEGDEDFVKEHDDVDGIFQKKHKELGLEFNRNEAKDLLRQSSKYIMKEKYKYNRPRPYQLAEFYNIDLNGFDLDSMKTPSYPSGHATQGYLLGKFYSNRHPDYRKEFMRLGEDIAESRIVAKAHFPSDKKAGIDLAEKLFDNLT
tara:strand:- start:903 stop:1520 length:618 start_codon:yes stop_codon:yes gene_type:complete